MSQQQAFPGPSFFERLGSCGKQRFVDFNRDWYDSVISGTIRTFYYSMGRHSFNVVNSLISSFGSILFFIDFLFSLGFER